MFRLESGLILRWLTVPVLPLFHQGSSSAGWLGPILKPVLRFSTQINLALGSKNWFQLSTNFMLFQKQEPVTLGNVKVVDGSSWH